MRNHAMGRWLEDFAVTLQQSLLTDFGLLQARRTIALLWKSMDTPSTGMWIKELTSYLVLERLTSIVKMKDENFAHLWRQLSGNL